MSEIKGCYYSEESSGDLLLRIARSYQCGKVEEIISVNDFGVEWKDSNDSIWFFQWHSIGILLNGWDRRSDARWFFDAYLMDEKEVTAHVLVTNHLMKTFNSLLEYRESKKNE